MLQPKYDINNEVFFITSTESGLHKGRIVEIHIDSKYIQYSVVYYDEEGNILRESFYERELHLYMVSLIEQMTDELNERLDSTSGVPLKDY